MTQHQGKPCVQLYAKLVLMLLVPGGLHCVDGLREEVEPQQLLCVQIVCKTPGLVLAVLMKARSIDRDLTYNQGPVLTDKVK
jgi:hypothetical protein